jgi:hypothetical protein
MNSKITFYQNRHHPPEYHEHPTSILSLAIPPYPRIQPTAPVGQNGILFGRWRFYYGKSGVRESRLLFGYWWDL